MDNPKFQKEYKEFRDAIDKISDQKIKLELEKLLKNLIFEVRMLDSKHEEMAFGNKLSDTGDYRQNLFDLRRQLNLKITECRKAKLI